MKRIETAQSKETSASEVIRKEKTFCGCGKLSLPRWHCCQRAFVLTLDVAPRPTRIYLGHGCSSETVLIGRTSSDATSIYRELAGSRRWHRCGLACVNCPVRTSKRRQLCLSLAKCDALRYLRFRARRRAQIAATVAPIDSLGSRLWTAACSPRLYTVENMDSSGTATFRPYIVQR